MATTSHHHLCPGEGGTLPRDRCALCGLLDAALREGLDELRDRVAGLANGAGRTGAESGGRILRREVLELIDEVRNGDG